MNASTVALIVFAGMMICVALFHQWYRTMREIRRHRIAERLGPGRDIPQIMAISRIDTAGDILGAPGLWIHTMRLRAGQPGPVGDIVAVCAVLAITLPTLLAWFLDGPVVLLGAFAGAVPIILLIRAAAARSRKISEQLPDALDLMARSLRAGHAFSDALKMAASESKAPIAEELSSTAEQHRLGLELRECLEGLNSRVPESFELRLFTGAVMLNRDTGGNLIEILENLARTIRERVVFEGKVKALTAEVRASANILSSLPIGAAVMLAVVEPNYLTPLTEPGLGQYMVVAGFISMVIGMYLMRRLAEVEM